MLLNKKSNNENESRGSNQNYREALALFIAKQFIPLGYKITKKVALDPVLESSAYKGLTLALNDKNIVYRKGKMTPDRPGAFLALWQRPSILQGDNNKPTPLTSHELDYLFIHVEGDVDVMNNNLGTNQCSAGMFIFPVSLLIEKGIVASHKNKGKTGFRVFPPWSQNRGVVGTKVFSESGKKTQRWQLPYFVNIDEDGLLEESELTRCLPMHLADI